MMLSLIVVFLSVQTSNAFKLKLMCQMNSHPNEDAGICYANCRSGYTGVLNLCMKNCKSGWKEVGPSCHRWNKNFGCKICYHGWVPYPCCKGGWEIQVRHTETRDAKEMMVAFSIDSGLEKKLKSMLAATKPITENGLTDLAQGMMDLDFKIEDAIDGFAIPEAVVADKKGVMAKALDDVKDKLEDGYNGMKSYSLDWVKDAIKAAFALYDTLDSIGRRRLELHSAGEHSSQTGEPVVLIDEEDEFVKELVDGTFEVMITKERLDENMTKMLSAKVGEDMRAAGKSEEEVTAALGKIVGDLKEVLFVDDEGKSGSMSIEEYLEGDRAEAVSARLEDDEGNGSVEEEGSVVEEDPDRRRRLGSGSSIDNCEYDALTLTVGGEISMGPITAFAGVASGFSQCGAGFFATAGIGGYIVEGPGRWIPGLNTGGGIEVSAALDYYLRGKYIEGRGRMIQFGFDLPETAGVMGPEPFGLELQVMLSTDWDVTGMGVTVSAGMGMFPVSITPLAATVTERLF